MPIRLRLTAVFALAMAAVLAGAGAFVYVRLSNDLNERIDAGLRVRAKTAEERLASGEWSLQTSGAAGFEEPRESFAQVLSPDGRVLDSTGGPIAAVLTAAEIGSVAKETIVLERRVDGIDATARVLAVPLPRPGEHVVLVVGLSLDDRNEALSGVVHSFAIGGPVSVLVASVLGYALARAGLRPMEAMRRRAGEIALGHEGGCLPLPPADDEVRRLGETLNDMLDRLCRSLERERRFVADASHELRTPIAVVKTELENALRTDDYGPQVREALVAAIDESDRLAQLAEDLLVIARTQDGGLPVRREALEVGGLLEAVGHHFADRASLHGRSIRIEADHDLWVSADPLRIRQALGNLVDNALRHGGGDIVLRAQARARSGDEGVELAVTDDGLGFGPDIASRAFERFTREEPSRSGEGTGLGLAIVRAITEAHGGSATIVSGPGATVRLWLPDPGPQEGLR